MTLTTHPLLVPKLSNEEIYTSTFPQCLLGIYRLVFTILYQSIVHRQFVEGGFL